MIWCYSVQRWSECEGGRVCLVREKVGGLLLTGQGDRRPTKHKVSLSPSSVYRLSLLSQTPTRQVTVLGPGHMTAADDHMISQPEGAEPTIEEAPLGARISGGGVASSQEEGKRLVRSG